MNKFKKHYKNKTDTWTHERILISTKITTLDHHIGRMVSALKEKNYWNNTVLVFTSDNGGRPKEGASNWPLRGSKGTIYDGGLKSRAFVASPLLQNRMKVQKIHLQSCKSQIRDKITIISSMSPIGFQLCSLYRAAMCPEKKAVR